MSMTDPLGDMLTRIRNAQMARKSETTCPASKVRGWVLDVLTREGYIRGYERREDEGGKPTFVIQLKYVDGCRPFARFRGCPRRGAASTLRSRICRRSITGLAFRSCRRRAA